jgi:hypothetical protein
VLHRPIETARLRRQITLANQRCHGLLEKTDDGVPTCAA